MEDFQNIIYMVERFLKEKRFTKKKLARLIGVKVKTINKICDGPKEPFNTDKFYIPLVKLYCNTRWDREFKME